MSPDLSDARADASEFTRAIQSIAKKPCLSYDLGPNDGSPVVDFHFGNPIRRVAPANGGDHGDVLLDTEGEISLYIACAWRLESRTGVVCGCWDDQSADGQMRTGLDQLVGQSVRRVVAVPPAWDLAVEFDNGMILRVFCDQTNDEEGADNYALYTAAEVFTVGTLSELYVSPREYDNERTRD